jgi:AraC-like DNA-binding protein
VWVGPERLLFVGWLGTLDWHRHSFAATLVGLDDALTMETSHGIVTGRVLHVPPATDHALWCGAGRVMTCYVGPHCRAFPAMGSQPAAWPMDDTWQAATQCWLDHTDPGALVDAIAATTPDATRMDHRVRRVARRLRTGQTLRASPAEVAATVGLSASRLSHLVKAHTGSTLGQLQLGYRFLVAAEAMLDATTFTEAAHRADFTDSAHFSKAFRAHYGVAPTAILQAQASWRRCTTL